MRGSTSGAGTRGLIKLRPNQKALQEWQVYQMMTYETQWKAIINEKWETYKNTWEGENLGKEFNESRFAFMNAFIKEKYLEETEEVKTSVRTRREELREAFELEGAEKNASYQR